MNLSPDCPNSARCIILPQQQAREAEERARADRTSDHDEEASMSMSSFLSETSIDERTGLLPTGLTRLQTGGSSLVNNITYIHS